MPVRAPVDTVALKRANPIADVAARYTELRRSGRALVGRCPLHADGKKPNSYVYEATPSFYCYCCNLGGDVIPLVELVEHLDFRAAAAHLGATEHTAVAGRQRPVRRRRPARPPRLQSPDEQVVLAAAVELDSNRLWGVPAVAPLGTYLRADLVELLRTFRRQYLCLDADDAGRAGISRLQRALGPSAVPVDLPEGTKDVGKLGPRVDGERVFARALLAAAGAPAAPASRGTPGGDPCP